MDTEIKDKKELKDKIADFYEKNKYKLYIIFIFLFIII